MKRRLAYYGNPILRKKAQPVQEITDAVRKLAADMIETIEAQDNAIGLSAPQVHESLQLFVVQFPDPKFFPEKWVPGEFEVHINPKILEISEKKELRSEGCLSIPKVYGEVPRPKKIKFQSMDLSGQIHIREYEGMCARMLLHEKDHLDGVLFIDRISEEEKEAIAPKLRAIKKQYK